MPSRGEVPERVRGKKTVSRSDLGSQCLPPVDSRLTARMRPTGMESPFESPARGWWDLGGRKEGSGKCDTPSLREQAHQGRNSSHWGRAVDPGKPIGPRPPPPPRTKVTNTMGGSRLYVLGVRPTGRPPRLGISALARGQGLEGGRCLSPSHSGVREGKQRPLSARDDSRCPRAAKGRSRHFVR